MSPAWPSRVVLVGFMGAGKTSVGRLLADRLGWRFVDVDEAVEARAGTSVREIFEAHGEPRFRELEDEVGAEVLDEVEVVVATGGGWAARPGRLRSLPHGTMSILLDVGPEEAVRRARRQPADRPLLDVGDPLAEARELLGARAEHYAEAMVRVDTEGRSVDDVTSRILEILTEHGLETQAE